MSSEQGLLEALEPVARIFQSLVVRLQVRFTSLQGQS